MSDDDMAHGAAVIALGTVDAIHTDSNDQQQLETYVRLRVEQQLKGLPVSNLDFAVPGGETNGVQRVVFGAPQFLLGERVLVFLRQRPDGQLAPVGLAMGKYTIVRRSDGDVARRQLGGPGTAVLAYDKGTGGLAAADTMAERPLAEFLQALTQTVATDPDQYVAPLSAPAEFSGKESAAYTFLGPPCARWLSPDQGRPVSYGVVASGDTTLGPVASLKVVQQAMSAWNNAGSRLRMVNSGDTTPAPYNACDGQNTIQFNDPYGEIGAPTNCGGILAIGGFCTTSTTMSAVNGEQFKTITEGDLTMNDGFQNCSFWTPNNVSEVVTHELGHTVGLGHSSEAWSEPNPDLHAATMFFIAHFDGRGAELRSDDLAAVRTLYGVNPRLRPRPVARRTRSAAHRSIERLMQRSSSEAVN